VAFRLSQRDPESISVALGQALADKQSRHEKPVTFGYEAGTPVRFAGEEVERQLGLNGEFGAMTNDKKDKNAQGYLKKFVDQWTSGAFSPMGGEPAPSSEETA
jgi:hypothetical protein